MEQVNFVYLTGCNLFAGHCNVGGGGGVAVLLRLLCCIVVLLLFVYAAVAFLQIGTSQKKHRKRTRMYQTTI